MHGRPNVAQGLASPVEDPVLCVACGALFGAGAEAETVCPYCAGRLHPLPAAREVLGHPGSPASADHEGTA